ncbi:DNA helicase IV [Kibdelosporangium banguiense]|uniref:DNA helicase IV n=1 Tax=Kibdelosporangium banguiense TaxID=1365924 RepID=A0ABS4U385_9PSEU|nr:ATP-binding domain-containing protein [Kibdelosporangium banguiense]MBP2331129.1 DNA helicase IV [Kibdelosporangium banguiense]
MSAQISLEQDHLATLYARLDELHADATRHLSDSDPADRAWWAGEVARLEAVADGLCFGRLDLADGRRVYIGRIGLFRESDDEPLLIDWRAPVARPFYTATAAAPEGVLRRRRITTRGRTVVDLNDEVLDGTGGDGLTGDAALLAAVTAGRTAHMSDIVTTLQAEQDRIIRDPHLGVLVVQGGPGTGKTAVALHRVAHLLYTHQHLRSRGVLVVGPSRIFLEYIGQVLPGLGENSVVTATITELYPKASIERPDTPEAARRKGEAAMAGKLAAAVRRRVTIPDDAVVIEFEREVLRLDPEECRKAVHQSRRAGLPHNQARLVFQQEIIALLAARMTARMEAVVLTETGEALDGGDPSGRLSDADLRALEAAGVVVDWSDTGPRQLLDKTDAMNLRDSLLADIGVQTALDSIWPALSVTDVITWPISPADIPLLDEVATLIGTADGATFGHIVVDEAQELSEMAWRMLMRRCPSRSMTIVGDLAQTSEPAGATAWDPVLRPHVADRWKLAELTVNYRTPTEIMAVANRVLAAHQPGIQPSSSIRSTGTLPWRVRTTPDDIPIAVTTQLRTMPGRTAVIAPHHHLRRLSDADAVLITPTEAKGLEFDSVLVVDPAAILASSPRGHNDLYVALTRATHRLGILHPGPIPLELDLVPELGDPSG